jgi:hypothetical protein
MCNSLNGINGLTVREKKDLLKISDYLILIYGLSVEESLGYINDYFNSNRFMEFFTIVNLTNDLFPFTGVDTEWVNK